MKKTAVITIIGIVVQALMSAVCYAELTQMLSPALQLELKGFKQGLAEISSQPAVDKESRIVDIVRELRKVYPIIASDKSSPSSWAELFLEIGLLRSTKPLRKQMQRLIHWMKTDEYLSMDDLERLAYIRRLAQDLTPFERILFYEGVHYSPEENDLGFGITTKRDWATLYFYGDVFFAHGGYSAKGKKIELGFGDDLTSRNRQHIPEVHYYAYMKKLMQDIIETKASRIEISAEQLIKLASRVDESFMPKSLNFYLIKVGGFIPQYKPKDSFNQQMQEEYISQMRKGDYIRYKDALTVTKRRGLVRDIAKEEKEYWEQAVAKPIEKKPLEMRIRSRDLLAFDDQEVFKMDYLDYPVQVTDKVVVEDLGYCSGMVIASGNSLWLRRYPEESNIMDALEADINSPDSEIMFNENTKIVLLNTSYGAWKWYFEQVKEELVKKGVRAENIVMSSWDDEPQIDGVGIYLFPTGQVVAHKKNFSLGVTKIIRYQAYLENHQNPDIIDRHGVEEIFEFVSSRNLFNNSISSNPVLEKLFYLVTVDRSI